MNQGGGEMVNNIHKHALKQIPFGELLLVHFSDGTVEIHSMIVLGCAWFRMSNDTFFDQYGFNFNPHQYGVYERCRKIVYGV